MSTANGRDTRRGHRPWWLGAAVIAVGGVWLSGALRLPQGAQYAQIGPGVFPALIGAGLVVLGVLLLVQIGRGEQFAPQESEDALADAPPSWPALLTALVAVVIPVVAMRRLGFPVTAGLVFATVARAFGSRRLLLDLALGLVLGFVCWYGFSALGVTLGAPLPWLGR
jgi:putative tricarboxylic transport membrane protein